MSYKIFANHAHVFPEAVRPQGTVEKLLTFMSECEIEKAVCFAPLRDQYEKSGLGGNHNDWLAREIENKDMLVGFGTVDFDASDIESQVRHMADIGLKGIKIHPQAQEIHLMSEKSCEMYAAAMELGLFLSFHSGLHWHRLADNRVVLFDEVAWNYPHLRFSMEHIGGYSFFNEALAVMCNNKRNSFMNTVFAGWTTIAYDKNGLANNWTVSDLQLQTLINQTGNERSIFGLDFPYNDAEYTKSAIKRIIELDIPEEAKRGILGENLEKIFNVNNDVNND